MIFICHSHIEGVRWRGRSTAWVYAAHDVRRPTLVWAYASIVLFLLRPSPAFARVRTLQTGGRS